MKIKFKKMKLSSNEVYTGVIKEVEYDKEKAKIRLFCELDSIHDELFMKSLKYSQSLNSPMGRFFDEMGVLDEKNQFDLDSLVDCAVEVTLNKARDTIWYIDQMWLSQVEEPDDNVFIDDDDDIDFDDDEED